MLVTYWFEVRINLLQNPTLLGRWTYGLIANIAVGTLAVGWLAPGWSISRLVTPAQLSFRTAARSIITIVCFWSLVGVIARRERASQWAVTVRSLPVGCV